MIFQKQMCFSWALDLQVYVDQGMQVSQMPGCMLWPTLSKRPFWFGYKAVCRPTLGWDMERIFHSACCYIHLNPPILSTTWDAQRITVLISLLALQREETCNEASCNYSIVQSCSGLWFLYGEEAESKRPRVEHKHGVISSTGRLSLQPTLISMK